MKALIYNSPKSVLIKDIEKPIPKNDQALIRIEYCGVCGGDISIYSGTHPRAKPPLIIGHEFVGIIEEIYGNSNSFKIGDRVAPYPLISCGNCFACKNGKSHVCDNLKLIGIDLNGGMAEYVCCNTDMLFKVPQSVPSEIAGLIEPLAVAVHTIHRAGFKPFDKIVIQGAGPIGIIIAIVARYSGANNIIISDIDCGRLNIAKKLGFNTINPNKENIKNHVKKITNSDLADIVFECTGTPSAALEMTSICRTDGTICLVGVHKKPSLINLADMHFRELKMIATRVYTKHDFKQAIELTKYISNDLKNIITHKIPLSNCLNIFNLIADPNVETVKILINCKE